MVDIDRLPPPSANSQLHQSHLERAINIFLDNGALYQAAYLFRREILAGLTPSTSVTTHLLRTWGTSRYPDPKVLKLVTEAIFFRGVRWDDGLRTAFLANLVTAGRYDLLSETMQKLRELAPEGWKPCSIAYAIMIRGFSLAKRPEAALRWLQKYRQDWSNQRDYRPYTALIAGLTGTSSPHVDPGPAYTVFSQMIEDGVAPHISAFNALLSLEVRALRIGRAFALFRVLERRYPMLKPNTQTYATMFKAHGVWHPGLRPTPRTPAARQLFKRLLQQHFKATRGVPSKSSPFLNTSILNVVIRTFIQTRDYAAAIVALRSFPVCKLPPTPRTEWIVSSTILRRMKNNLSDEGDPRFATWISRMMGKIVEADNAQKERAEISSLLSSMKRQSSIAAKSLSQHELAKSRRSIDEMLDTLSNPRQAGWTLQDPQKQVRGTPTDLKSLLQLVQHALRADISFQVQFQEDIDQRFISCMAQACADILPIRKVERS